MDVLSRFHPLVREWFTTDMGTPTSVQTRAWEAIADGGHVLLSAPTGSGKTLAAFLWALDGLIAGRLAGGKIRVLYISPLKALNNDIQKNLARPLAGLEKLFTERGQAFPKIRTQTRSGDTPEHERRTLHSRPPEILITTPESLNILLASPQAALLFNSLAAVILDEIHAVLESKRGTHLIAGVERLTRFSGEFQRIVLSATVKPLESVAAFSGGFVVAPGAGGPAFRPRPVRIIEEKARKKYELNVTAPFQAEGSGPEETWWGPLVALCRAIIDRNRSTLFFAASRKKTEKLARLINEGAPDILAYSHHGALSREIRLSVEEQLKNGRLRAIVATGTLELGIDIGELDEVVLIQSPASVAQAIQRIGRAGHQVEGVSRGTLVPLGGIDLLHLGALARAVAGHEIESILPPEAPLDVLAQIILSMTSAETWKTDELYAFLRTIHPYRNMSRSHFDLVIAMLAGNYAETNIRELEARVVVDAVAGTVTARRGSRFLLYLSGGTIPDRGFFELRHAETGVKLGELDEEFVWERNIGDTFLFGQGTWRIQRITDSAVEAAPLGDVMAMAPFYRAEEQNRSFHFAALIGEFLEKANRTIDDEATFSELLEREYHFTSEGALALGRFLRSQREMTGRDLPHRRHVLIERCWVPLSESRIEIVIIHTFWGGRVNKPLADGFAFLWEKRFGHPLEHYADNNTILFHLPHRFSAELFKELVCSPDLIPALLERITQTAAFGALFRENAGRALLLPKTSFRRRMPFWLTRLRSKNLLAAVLRFPEFPLLKETAQNLREEYYDLASLALVADELRNNVIRLSETSTSRPSPLAAEVVWRMTNQYMYESDELKAHAARPWQTEERLLFDPRLLQAVPPSLVSELERKLKRLHPGYTPQDSSELLLLLQERLAVPAAEWEELARAVDRDHPPFQELTAPKQGAIVSLRMPRAGFRLYLALETVPLLCTSLGCRADALDLRTLENRPVPVEDLAKILKKFKVDGSGDERGEKIESPEIGCAAFLAQFLRFYGPVPESLLIGAFGLEDRLLQASLNLLLQEEKIVYGRLLEGDTSLTLCDRENYGRLLALRRRARRPAAPLFDLDCLPLFLAASQNLLSRPDGPDALPRALEGLLGWPAPAALWEEALLPVRIASYQPGDLDLLLARTNLLWTGAGKGKLFFSFPEDLPLFQAERTRSAASLFPHERGRYSLEDLVVLLKTSPPELQETLWQGVWQGEIANTSFETMRQALALDFKFKQEGISERKTRPGRADRRGRFTSRLASAGSWFPLPRPEPSPEDSAESERNPVEALEEDKERARVLLDRYGCLCRELTAHEAPACQWQRIFPALRLMELSGEVVGGSFFKGLPGIQFMTEEALASIQAALDQDRVFWMNALDPASCCGRGLSALQGVFPERLVSTWLVFAGKRLVLVLRKNGAELEFRTNPEDPALPGCFEIFSFLISRAVNPLKSVKVEKINAEAALSSPFAHTLHEYGFEESYRALVLRKRY